MKRLILVALLLSTGCVSMRLENNLPPKIRAFYDEHYFIMEYKVPADIDRKCPTEREYFLKLSPTLQEKYIELFWKIREIGMKEEYDLRLEVANKWFKGEGMDGYKTDRGRIMLICGQPDHEFWYLDDELYLGGGEEWIDLTQHKITLVWKYWWGSGLASLIELWFYYDNNRRWKFIEPMDKEIQDFMYYWRWRTAPTKDGWRLWQEAIK
jgi:GWxTD domain-containing protein